MKMTEKWRINDGKVAERSWSSAFILLLAAVYFAVAGDLPHVPLFTLLLLAFAFSGTGAWKISDRTIIYSAVTALTLAVLGNYLWPTRNGRFGFLAFFLRPMLLVPLFLYAAALLHGFRRKPLALAAAAAAAFFTFSAGGGLYGRNLPEAERMLFLNGYDIPVRTFYMISLAVTCAVTLYALRGGRRIITLILIALTALLCWGEIRLYLQHEQAIRQLENRLLRFGFRQIRNRGGGQIHLGNRGGNLNMPFFQPDEVAGSRIILRVTGTNHAPGYLRTQSFRNYNNGSWENPAAGVNLPLEVLSAENPLYADQTFLLPDGLREGETLRIYPDARLAGKPILLPDESAAVEMIAEAAELTDSGRIIAESMLPAGGYLIWKNPGFPPPGDADPEHFLEIPAHLREPFTALVTQLKLDDSPSAREKVAKLKNFFDANFSYALDWRGSAGEDPTLLFLEKIRRGHCELFASGAALLLRAADVPARYVTGVVCFESRGNGRYYVARLRNAHAWVEYFDRATGRWQRFDPTPESVLENAPELSTWDEFEEQARFFGQDLFGAFRRGHLTASLAEFGFFLLRYGAPAFLLFLLYRRWRRHFRNEFPLNARQRRARREFRRLIRTLRRRGLELPPDPSAEEIFPLLTDPAEQHAVREYQRLRFRPDVPASTQSDGRPD